jgi:transcriptional regulator with XRE-family HTH domain
MTKTRKLAQHYIRQWRHHRGLTLQQVAERTDMTPSHLSMLERGQRGYTQLTLEAVAAALRTDVGSLVMRDPSNPDDIRAIWDKATPDQRRQIMDVAIMLVMGKRR